MPGVPVAAIATTSRGLAAMRTLTAALPRWAVLLLAATVARALTFGNPLVDVDEGFYLLTAQRMAEGAIPYVDIWDRKPIGLFLVYLPAGLLPPAAGVWAYQLLALASVVATGLLVARLADAAGWRRGAMPAALLYVLMLDFADGQGGQAPVFYNLLTALAVLLVLPSSADMVDERRRQGRAVLAMGVIGLALQIKYSVLFEGLFLGLWLLWREWRLDRRAGPLFVYAVTLVAAALLPTIVAGAVFGAMGHGDAWLYANFLSILGRQSDPAAELLRSLAKMALVLAPLLLCSGMSRHVAVANACAGWRRRLYFGWLIAAIVGLLAFGGYFNHYVLPVLLPAALCSAGFLGEDHRGRAIAPWLLGIALVGGVGVTLSARLVRGDGSDLAALAQAIGPGEGCIYVYSGTSTLYSHTHRCAPSRFVFPSHLTREREAGALGVDQVAELDRVFASRPAFVILKPPFKGERLSIRARALAHLRRDGYRLKGRWPVGNTAFDLFARQPAPARRAATSPS